MATEPQLSPFPIADSDRCAVLTRTVIQRRAYFIRTVQRLSLPLQDAEDVVQEAVLRAFTNLSTFRGESRMDTWLHTIVVNTALTWLRRRGGRTFVSLECEGPSDRNGQRLDIPHPGKSPEESCRDHRLHCLLMAEIQSLDPIYRNPIEACDLDERSYSEAAEVLDIKLSTLKARLFRGRATLKRRLRQS